MVIMMSLGQGNEVSHLNCTVYVSGVVDGKGLRGRTQLLMIPFSTLP